MKVHTIPLPWSYCTHPFHTRHGQRATSGRGLRQHQGPMQPTLQRSSRSSIINRRPCTSGCATCCRAQPAHHRCASKQPGRGIQWLGIPHLLLYWGVKGARLQSIHVLTCLHHWHIKCFAHKVLCTPWMFCGCPGIGLCWKHDATTDCCLHG